jgi:hypothetical protein
VSAPLHWSFVSVYDPYSANVEPFAASRLTATYPLE